MASSMLIEHEKVFVEIGDIILANGEMVYLRDFDMYSAKVEYEDGTLKWVYRGRLTTI